MARRISWSFLLGLGAGLVFLRLAARGQRRGRMRRRSPLPREPEVVRGTGPTPVEAGLERPVASASPDASPDRAVRSVPPPRSPPRERTGFEPVLPDAPEERDPALEPHGADPNASTGPVPPQVRRRH